MALVIHPQPPVHALEWGVRSFDTGGLYQSRFYSGVMSVFTHSIRMARTGTGTLDLNARAVVIDVDERYMRRVTRGESVTGFIIYLGASKEIAYNQHFRMQIRHGGCRSKAGILKLGRSLDPSLVKNASLSHFLFG